MSNLAEQGIIGEWANVQLPPVPELKPVTVDPKTTALLVLDMMKGNCGARPRCLATIPNVKKLLEAARAHDMMVVYNLTGAGKVEDMVDLSLAPRPGEFMVKGARRRRQVRQLQPRCRPQGQGHQDRDRDRHSAQGAVGGTTNGAAQRGYKAVVPIDGMSGEDAFNELYAIWHIYKGGPVNLTSNATVTRSDLIRFGD